MRDSVKAEGEEPVRMYFLCVLSFVFLYPFLFSSSLAGHITAGKRMALPVGDGIRKEKPYCRPSMRGIIITTTAPSNIILNSEFAITQP